MKNEDKIFQRWESNESPAPDYSNQGKSNLYAMN